MEFQIHDISDQMIGWITFVIEFRKEVLPQYFIYSECVSLGAKDEFGKDKYSDGG
jgi:hypothetical protein